MTEVIINGVTHIMDDEHVALFLTGKPPKGYVLVPVEPTEAIKHALYKNKGFSEEMVYEEILRAAQEAE